MTELLAIDSTDDLLQANRTLGEENDKLRGKLRDLQTDGGSKEDSTALIAELRSAQTRLESDLRSCALSSMRAEHEAKRRKHRRNICKSRPPNSNRD